MPIYRIHRMKEAPRLAFRWAPHSSGLMALKPRDFEPGGEIEAASAYHAWTALRGTEQALAVGDVLESGSGTLAICKYVGFEDAQWVAPELKAVAETAVMA